jgi:DNA segregation ATPase FtsK/SpoIIIE-like protein
VYSIGYQRELIQRLSEEARHRATEERDSVADFESRQAAALEAHRSQREATLQAFETEHADFIRMYKEAREGILFEYETAGYALAQEEDGFRERAAADFAEATEEAQADLQRTRHRLESDFLEKQLAPQNEFNHYKQQCDNVGNELARLVGEAQAVTRRRTRWPDPPATPPAFPGLTRQEYLQSVATSFAQAREKLHRLQYLPVARFLEEGWLVIIFLFLAVGDIYPLWMVLGSYGVGVTAAACVLTPLILTAVLWVVLKPIAARQTQALVPQLQQHVAQAHTDLAAAIEAAQAEMVRAQKKLVRRRDRALASAQEEYDQATAEHRERHESLVERHAAEISRRRKALEEKHERRLSEIERTYPERIERTERFFAERMLSLANAYRSERNAIGAEYEARWNAMSEAWSEALASFRAAVQEMNAYCDAHFQPWDEARTGPASENRSVGALRIGQYEVDVHQIAHGVPADERLELPGGPYELPATLAYPECPSLLLEAEDEGREAAADTIQNAMLRLLTTFPPGKVRFTIIDPVGLGQNFSAFMHLADYDDKLVHSRIWTEANHINQRLTDLTEHMENVIQKYLRNEFASIEAYNEQAGEVAEPFQILVVANFPANFSEESARRLVSIAASGARCGVYTLISTDKKLKLPRNFDLADLEAQAAAMVWDAERKAFAWKYPELRSWPLHLDEPPNHDRFTEIVRQTGQQAKDAARVEVPFESIVPVQEHWWEADSRSEVAVPLGRAGAKKMQYLRLGPGTSQHVLIAGKTGSGKSTLLNAMITSLAVHYSPSELEFYLIDFKKGVEFKAYAAERLPHARVIAIESEREFGLSVLDRLDIELKRRGDLFRQFGVQDLKGYRNTSSDDLPRVLLVIDEFQEFFTSDDKIAHDAALLLDRLVRQGRAFGIHVLLGSQTLAGAYTLARSTIGQMAVRIALQCSESDAHLILSEDNTAARLLSRPGEAIYNDQNGLLEGNHLFQVVWLSDHERASYLSRLAREAEERRLTLPATTVFEGNVAADPAENEQLQAVLNAPTFQPTASPRAWVGAAVAIKEPTNVAFRRQAGANLVVVGQQEDLALGILSSCVLSLAAQSAPRRVGSNGGNALHNVYVLDGSRPDAPDANFWRRLVDETPLDLEVVGLRHAADTVRKLAEEVDRRLTASDSVGESVYVCIYNLARFRDLKKSEDFGRFDDDSGPAADKQLTKILREGPGVGIHVLLWCDSYANLARWLERNSIRDCDHRVLFQMSANDSSNLMDSPAASKLGTYMALLYSEEQGQAEKFRPYRVPSSAWLQYVAERFERRAAAPAEETPAVSEHQATQ